ncbi:hypothetical protein KQX54_003016 [Cotesia glomerata]|uniref:Uncharacterized protein n=1 Tax=Cotesia glomerata TaxID=32391 RepID=A0AAV7I6V7_COTGL|nr:hypothetical protein KQX54_003016 [Cotesia glomerata]
MFGKTVVIVVLLTLVKHACSLQVHEVAGYEVTAFNNVFDGQYRVHKYAATSILVFDNESKGNPFYDIVMDDLPNFMHDSVHKYTATSILMFDNESKGHPFYDIVMDDLPDSMHDSYPNDLSSHETGAFNDITQRNEWTLGRSGPETFDLPPGNFTRFLQEVKFGSNIKRPADAAIVKKLEDFFARRSQNQYLKNIDINERRIY